MFRAYSKHMSMLFVLLSFVALIGCRTPVTYGFDPEANRDFWESREITQVMTIYPGNCQQGVSATTPVRFTFSRTVGMSERNFTIYNLSDRGRKLPYKLVKSDDNRTYTAALREPLYYGAVYVCEVTGVKDSKGKSVPDMSWTFNTRVIPENAVAAPAKWRSDYGRRY